MTDANNKSVLQRTAILSGLVSREELQDALDRAMHPSIGPPAPRVKVSDNSLAKELVAMGLVTRYQVEQLKAGRTKLTLGPYLVTDWIAQGGMGQVFKAEHQMMGREVAIKVLPHSRSNPSSISNFTREIRTQAILDHHNLVRAYDAGHDGNVYYLVCEYVDGTDLRRFVRSNGALNMAQAASIISQAALGLHYAHEKGLVHRDIKPGNILVTPAGHAKVSDLGLAGFLESDTDPRKHKIVGTADYISPEQIKTPENVTPVSDIYSLGCTLYYSITSKVPFPGGTTRDKARRHCEETPWHPRRFAFQVDDEFVDLIADMMEKDPKNRVQTAAEVAVRLEAWAESDAPLPAQPPLRSSWMPPPPPATSENDEPLQDTQDGSSGSLEYGSQSLSEFSQASQTTDGSLGSQETRREKRRRRIPLLPMVQESLEPKRFSPVFIALAISIPVSLLLGVLITLVAMLLAIRTPNAPSVSTEPPPIAELHDTGE